MDIEKLDQWPNQFAVEGGINKLTRAMSRQFGVGIHGRDERGAIDHLESLQKLQSVPMLGDKVALRSLLDLEPKEEMKETHVGHFKLPGEGSFGGRNVGIVAISEDKKSQQAINMEDVKVGVSKEWENPTTMLKECINPILSICNI